MTNIKRQLIKAAKNLRFLSSIAVRLTKLTGKSKSPIHPKHLVNQENSWFLTWIKPGNVVLDLGCDQGINSQIVAKVAAKVVALDANPEAIAKASLSDNIVFQVANLEKGLDFSDESFDVVLLLDVLEHLKNRDRVMEDVHRVLKNRGLLLLSIPNSQTSWKKLQRQAGLNSFADPDHKIEYTLEQAVKVCTQAGFKVLSVKGVTYDTPWAPLIDLVGGMSLTLYAIMRRWKDKRVLENFRETTGFRMVAKKDEK